MYWVKTTKISPKAFFFCLWGAGVVRDRFWVVFVSSKPQKKKKKKKRKLVLTFSVLLTLIAIKLILTLSFN